MAVFLIEKTLDYTVMSNRHLHNTRLALKEVTKPLVLQCFQHFLYIIQFNSFCSSSVNPVWFDWFY